MATSATASKTRATRDAMVEEARAIVDAARERGVVLRLFGGLGVRAWCDVVSFCERDYSDIDLIGLHRQRAAIRDLFRDLGFEENVHVSLTTRGRQLQFVRPCRHGASELSPRVGRRAARGGPQPPPSLTPHPDDHVDVFLDTFRMDHDLQLRDRLALDKYTLSVSDQLLTKLQVSRQDEKDMRDVLTLLKDLEVAEDEGPGVIGLGYVAERCAEDWGLSHDVERNLDRTEALASVYALAADEERRVRERVALLRRALAKAPKSLRWRLRARIGERLPWHNDVEEQGREDGAGAGRSATAPPPRRNRGAG